MELKKIFCLAIWLFCIQTAMAELEISRLKITDGIRNEMLKQTIENNVSDFLYACNTAAINGKMPNLNKKITTDDARNRFAKIWQSSPIACSVSELERKCLSRPSGGYQIRNIPVIMFEASEEEQNQEIVITLTADGRIDDIFVPVAQYTDILNAHNETENIVLRMMVLDFVENFRTAYNRKDANFIESVFSNNAVIIVGKEIKQKPNSDAALRHSLSSSQFEYQIKNKQQYMFALRNVFKNTQYINVEFDEIMVLQHENYPQVYGVTLKQFWDSNLLKNDIGYVFLLIDFRDINKPLIHVRTWQPEQYDGRQLKRNEIFQIGDFDLNRF